MPYILKVIKWKQSIEWKNQLQIFKIIKWEQNIEIIVPKFLR